MNPQGLILTILILVVISTVVGAVAKMLNNLADAAANRRAEDDRRARAERLEKNAARARAAEDERAERPNRAAPASATAESHTGGTVKPANSEMDRFLAEIDRLRRKAAVNPDPPPTQPGSAAPVAPVVQPIKPANADRPRRVVAELAAPTPTAPVVTPIAAPVSPPTGAGASFGTSPQAPTRSAPVAAQVEQLPVAQVLRTTSSTGAPATRVTRFGPRARPADKTNFGKNLAALLSSGQGAAMAVVLMEVLGPPKSKQPKE